MGRRYWLFLTAIVILYACHPSPPEKKASSQVLKPPIFSLLSSDQTHITFRNTLQEGLNTNILMYEYFYNGAGVAIADFNGDDLPDIYFTANMEKNRLYLNKGGMVFEDVTDASGVGGRPGPWTTGVTYADVNGDNRIDLYVCYSGTVKEENRKNQLFINEGNNENNVPVFSEQAEKYGIASAGYSNQGYFFDADHDNDLDLLLLNHNPQSLPVLNEVQSRQMLLQDDPMRGVRLFLQENNRFEDVTKRSGISCSGLTYALGAGISDVNGDGWEDIYISNDYAVPDYLYINNKNGTFSDKIQEMLGHTSHFSMGNDIADVNNDGMPDIFTLDMLPEDNARQKLLMSPDNFSKFDLNLRSGFYYQYMRNMLHLNHGNNTFSEIGQFAGISNTDWSWAALFADFNNDSNKDLFITNGYLRDYTNLDFIRYMDDIVKSKGRLKREDVLEMIQHMPSSDVMNYMFANTGTGVFTNETIAWGGNVASNSNGAAYGDLDNDGDLDLVVNNINQEAFIFENRSPRKHFLAIALQGEGSNTLGIGAQVTVSASGTKQRLDQMPSRGYLSAVSPVLHFGLSDNEVADTLLVQWPSGKSELLTNVRCDTLVTLRESNARTSRNKAEFHEPIFLAAINEIVPGPAPIGINDFKRQPQLITELSHKGIVLASGDVNGDGSDDLFVGGTASAPSSIYVQSPDGSFSKHVDLPINGQSTAAAAIFADIDNDGDADLYVASGGYHDLHPKDARLHDQLYLNDGTGQFSYAGNVLPPMPVSKSCVAAADFNSDGYIDLFVGGRVTPGRYPEAPQSFLLVNNRDGSFRDATAEVMPEFSQAHMITDAKWTDFNNDQNPDLVLAGEWMPLTILIQGNGRLINRTKTYLNDEYSGWWNCIEVEDLNSDGKPDLIAGNLGLNTQYTASQREPAEMYFSDFDKNGSVDPILCLYIQGKSYPYLTRDEMLEQLGYLRSRYPDYKSYADQTLQDIFTPEEIAGATRLRANTFQTSLFLSTPGKNQFDIIPLPAEVQFSPVNTITVQDFDQDSLPDILFCGNNRNHKLKIGKADANYGTLLKGDGRGGFRYIPQRESGLRLRGDVNSVVLTGKRLIVGLDRKVVSCAFGKKASTSVQQTASIR